MYLTKNGVGWHKKKCYYKSQLKLPHLQKKNLLILKVKPNAKSFKHIIIFMNFFEYSSCWTIFIRKKIKEKKFKRWHLNLYLKKKLLT